MTGLRQRRTGFRQHRSGFSQHGAGIRLSSGILRLVDRGWMGEAMDGDVGYDEMAAVRGRVTQHGGRASAGHR
jgi:hypothetical protein